MIWVTVEDADTYFLTRLGASEYWNTATEKEAALTTAENDIAAVYNAVPEPICVYEQALFRLVDLASDKRAYLQAQGVVSAGIIKESYRHAGGGIAICPYVQKVMGSPNGFMSMPEVALDEDYD